MRPPELNPSDPPAWLRHAPAWDRRLANLVWLIGIATGGALLGGFLASPGKALAVRGLIGVGGAAILAGIAALNAASRLAHARALLAQALALVQSERERQARGEQSLFSGEGQTDAVQQQLVHLRSVSGWQQLPAAVVFLAAAGVLLVACWPRGGPIAGELVIGIAAMALAFPLLVLERHLALTDPQDLPDAPALATVWRLPVAALLVGGCAAVLHAHGFAWAVWVEQALAVLVTMVVLELGVRLVALIFLPPATPEQATGFADSLVARLLPWPGDRRTDRDVLRRRFNIDLSQSWAVRFFLRALVPVGAVLALVCWLLSALTVLAIDERGILEHLGRPVAVLQPGLHVHLPWPFDSVRRVERGRIHDLSLADVPEQAHAGLTDPDARPAPSADRRWEVEHPSESFYLVPALNLEKGQSYEMVACDLRVRYRVGLSDAQALASAYQVDDPDTLVRSAATHLLVHDFCSRTLAHVIGEDRDALARDLTSHLQAQLDQDRAGLEVTAVVIEAIHPPPGAAVAYQNVQAAEILTATEVAQARSDAEVWAADTKGQVAATVLQAQGDAAEAVSVARSAAVRIEADQAAFARYGTVFRLERWLQALAKNLPKAGRMIIIDHRLQVPDGVFVDLRPKE